MTNINLTPYLNKAKQEIQEMEDQYVGCTEAQQRTLDLLKKADQNYILSKKVLLAKIAYLEALLEKQKSDQMFGGYDNITRFIDILQNYEYN